MQILFYFFVLFFRLTNQLKCVRVCQNQHLRSNEILLNSSLYEQIYTRCSQNWKPKQCQGRLMIHYEKDFHLKSFSYTFNRTTHIVENEIEQLANQYRSNFLIYFLLAFQSITKEFILTIYVLCQTYNECAYDTINRYIISYNLSSDLIDKFERRISSDLQYWKIFCRNFQRNSIEQCQIRQNERCFYEKFHQYERSFCTQTIFEQFEYEFFFTNKTIYKRRELLICNTDYCTNETIRKDIEQIIFSNILKDYEPYTFFNYSNRFIIEFINNFIIDLFQ